jgi:hypothetical protein
MKNLILLSYGREADYRMAIFAVLSFWAWFSGKKSDVRTFIFTDNPEYFYPSLSDLDIKYELLSPSKLDSMMGGMDYIHRRKIGVINEVFDRYPSDDLIFLDSDTFFMSDALPWFQIFAPGNSFMHSAEYTFEEAVKRYSTFNQAQYPEAFIRLIENRAFLINKAETYFHRKQVSWNSGVLGLTKEIASLLPDVFSLTDEFYRATLWNTSEQIAFSLALQTKTKVLPCEQYVFHYWGQRQKKLIDQILVPLVNNDFVCLDLKKRLEIVKELSSSFPKRIQLDKLKERSINAFSKNYFLSGCKYALYAFAESPFDFHFLKELVFVQVNLAQQKYMRKNS